MISAKVISDSVSPSGVRITTIEGMFPRWILAELNTHRVLSRNSASSRAIPVSRIISQVWREPAEPVSWGANQSGMQARNELSGFRRWIARRLFRISRFPAIAFAWTMSKVGLHKQVVNRILEPWITHKAIITATQWQNFFKLRLHPDAQPEFQKLAQAIKDAMDASIPVELQVGHWHLPYVTEEDYAAAAHEDHVASTTLSGDHGHPALVMVSAARCARVSYVRQNEKRELSKDVAMAERLSTSGHWSPFEHVAMCVDDGDGGGNFPKAWKQLRKFYPNESGEQ